MIDQLAEDFPLTYQGLTFQELSGVPTQVFLWDSDSNLNTDGVFAS